MSGRWTVKRIVKNGTVFPWWRVQVPSGQTLAVLRDRRAAMNYATKLAEIAAMEYALRHDLGVEPKQVQS